MAQEEKIIPERWRNMYRAALAMKGDADLLEVERERWFSPAILHDYLAHSSHSRVMKVLEELGAAESALATLTERELIARRTVHNLGQHNQYFERCEHPICNPIPTLVASFYRGDKQIVPGDRAKLAQILELQDANATQADEMTRLREALEKILERAIYGPSEHGKPFIGNTFAAIKEHARAALSPQEPQDGEKEGQK